MPQLPEEHTPSDRLQKWLSELETQSWNLELLVSGFSIFLLIGALEVIPSWTNSLMTHLDAGGAVAGFTLAGLGILELALEILIINLLIHVILRGLWIGAVGLRSVSPKVDFERLRFNAYFDRLLRERMPKLDQFILNLDRWCSLVFSLTFLMVFALVAMGGFFVVMALLTLALLGGLKIMPNEGWPHKIFLGVIIILQLLVQLSGLLYLIDFVSLGRLKRQKRFAWFNRMYRFIHRFWSFWTLAGLYRPIYYHIISHQRSRRLVYLILPYILALTILPNYIEANYYSLAPTISNAYLVAPFWYDDTRPEDAPVRAFSLPSKTVTHPYLELFVQYEPRHNELLTESCPDFEPPREPGIRWKTFADPRKVFAREAGEEEALTCIRSFYQIDIDQVAQPPIDWLHMVRDPFKTQGFYAQVS
ncbi:MAG: hypothetical protein AAFV07_16100, partial [Bacteroidota bacterium]